MNRGKKQSTTPTRVIGSKAFAAISAVEGLRLSASATQRFKSMDERGLSPDQRRAEVIRAYMESKKRG